MAWGAFVCFFKRQLTCPLSVSLTLRGTGRHMSSSFRETRQNSQFCVTASPSCGWCPPQRWPWSWCRWPWWSQTQPKAGLHWLWWWWAGTGSQGWQSPICFSVSAPQLVRKKPEEEWAVSSSREDNKICLSHCVQRDQLTHHLTPFVISESLVKISKSIEKRCSTNINKHYNLCNPSWNWCCIWCFRCLLDEVATSTNIDHRKSLFSCG